MAYPFDLYKQMFLEKTGAKFNKEEAEYIKKFGHSLSLSSSKKIYFFALYSLKKSYPLFIVRYIVQFKVKKTFQREGAPQSFQKIHKDFAEIILSAAIKKYSRR